ncbi:MAG TPA: hypothetical protein PKL76_20780, partial [Phycisphaerae bacterium]|nr:hypothetical protein [Phycisphaerae bacterium]
DAGASGTTVALTPSCAWTIELETRKTQNPISSLLFDSGILASWMKPDPPAFESSTHSGPKLKASDGAFLLDLLT